MLCVVLFLFTLGCARDTTGSKDITPTKTVAVRVAGAGSGYPALQALAEAFQTKNREVPITFLPSNQTTGAITGTKLGIADIGTVTRPPKPEEAEGRLHYKEFARDALLIATHPSVVGVTNLGIKDVRAIYSGDVRNWRELGGPDATIIVLDRPEDESAKMLLRQHILGAELVISPSAINLKQETELIGTLRDTPYSIGAFSLAYAATNGLAINRLSIEGIAPSVENVRVGQYRMVRSLGIIWTDEVPAAARSFRDFIFSNEGSKVLQQKGYAPSS